MKENAERNASCHIWWNKRFHHAAASPIVIHLLRSPWLVVFYAVDLFWILFVASYRRSCSLFSATAWWYSSVVTYVFVIVQYLRSPVILNGSSAFIRNFKSSSHANHVHSPALFPWLEWYPCLVYLLPNCWIKAVDIWDVAFGS